jgi:hypothetical protein
MFDKWPSKLNIELSTACNAACPQCSRYLDDDPELGIVENPNLPQNTLTLDVIKTLIDHEWLKQAKHVKFEGTHGEPTMAKDCTDILRWFREVNPTVTFALHTNGSTRNKEWWRELAQFFQYNPERRSAVTFSLDGIEDTNHIYRRRTVWKKIMENAQAFIDAGGVAVWDMIVFEHNEHQVLKARKLAKSMGFFSFGVKVSQRTLIRPIQWLKQPKTWKENQGTGTVKINCIGKQFDELFLNANGLYMPCCFINENAYGPAMPSTQKEIEEVLGDFSQYHSSNGLDHALELFHRVSDRWETNPMEICKHMCGNGHWPDRLQQKQVTEVWPERFRAQHNQPTL